ncbi:hypothetical protein ScPMuIL_016723 [Solemya velum]
MKSRSHLIAIRRDSNKPSHTRHTSTMCASFPTRKLFRSCSWVVRVLKTLVISAIVFLLLEARWTIVQKQPVTTLVRSIAQRFPLTLMNQDLRPYFKIDRKVKNVNCFKLITNDSAEHYLARILELEHTAKFSKRKMRYFSKLDNSSACSDFIAKSGYIMDSLTSEEEEFPLAYSIVMFKDQQQTEMLLRAIYRPQNYYCIHLDKKSHFFVKRDMVAIANCFPNVFIASQFVNVIWGGFTLLKAEMACLGDLWKYKKWKYFINLTGQEFPLKTNYELVKILRSVEGANFVGALRNRYKRWWIRAGRPPHGLTVFKGSGHVVINRDFVDFCLHTQIGQDFLNWTRNIDHSFEFYFNTLNHNTQLGIPGSFNFTGRGGDFFKKPLMTRVKIWEDSPNKERCKVWQRSICILGLEQLPMLASSREFFANKFQFSRVSYYTQQCLDELIYNRTRAEYLGETDFDTRYYTNLWQYKYKI